MMKCFLLIVAFILAAAVNAQQNKVKLGVLGVPFFQSGFGMVTIGYERLNTELKASWQLHLNIAGGSIANDAPTHTRKWGTIEKTFYQNHVEKKFKYSFSAFTEIGNRVTKPGYVDYPQDSILQKTTAFEINPGVNLGLHYRFSKKWGIEIQGGPKLILANAKEHYINSVTRQKFNMRHHEVRAGWMFTGNFYFQF